MSERAELYRTALDVYNRRDKEAWFAFVDPEVENHPPREWPESTVCRGPDEVWDFLVRNLDAFDVGEIEVAGPIEESGDALLVPLRADVRGKGSGVEMEWALSQVATFRGDKVIRIAWFVDHDEAREAAGIG